LWAPLIDRFGRRYFWIVPAQLAVAGFTALLAVFDPVGEKVWFWMLLTGICLSSATQDMAADAYTIDILEERELGPANGIRSAAYRVALVAAGGLLVMASDWVGWAGVHRAAVWMVILRIVLSFRLPSEPPGCRPALVI
jgi:PAT family beta-lactamase induction signal transducer AmpG